MSKRYNLKKTKGASKSACKSLPKCAAQNDIIPVILSADNNYAPYMYVTILSMLETANPTTQYDLWLLVPSLFSAEFCEKFKSLEKKYNCLVHFVDMKDAFSDLKMYIPHITTPTYYRLLAAELLPKEYNKCIYLDADMCVCHDLSELFNIDMKDNYIAGVVAAGYYFNEIGHCKRLNIPSMKTYINAGTILINLNQIRKDNLTPKFLNLSKNNYTSQDQDVINVACYGKIITLPPKYNCMVGRLYENDKRLRELYTESEIEEAKDYPVIVHYADRIKPWNDMSTPMAHHWVKYAELAKKEIDLTDILDYKRNLQIWWRKIRKEPLNLDNPKTYNEKIHWLKLYNSTPIKTRLADKYLVRGWVKNKIGEKYLIPFLGVYDRFEDINFDTLPNQFVIKCNHGCAYNYIVKDKKTFDKTDARKKIKKWMNENYAFHNGVLELQYRDIKPKIIIEKFIENKSSNGDLYDYKFWCFNGKVEYIQFLSGRNLEGLKMAFYDKDWNKQNFVSAEFLDQKDVEKPINLDKMIELAEKLSTGFNHVRVDFYHLDDGTIYFGEMTFSPAGGTRKWRDERIDMYLGSLFKLPKLAYNLDTGKYYKLSKKDIYKTYLLFPCLIIKKIKLFKRINSLLSKLIINDLRNYRIDIKNIKKAENSLLIIARKSFVSFPSWFKNDQGIGSVLTSYSKKQTILIKAINDGKLFISFRGENRSLNKVHFPVWIDYKSIKIDGKEILAAPAITWHDEPFTYEIPVKNAQVMRLEVETSPHQYTKEELKETILKLKPSSKYINNNIDAIVDKIYLKVIK